MSKKKFTVLIVVLAMLLTLMVPAFATANSSITVFFTNTYGWSSVNVYAWDGEGDITGSWAGDSATFVATNNFGQGVYKATLSRTPTGIIFNGGGQQTVDITTNIHNNAAWYILDGQWENGKAKVEYYDVSCTEIGHSLTAHPAVDATCTAAGDSAYYECTVCGKFFSDDAGTNEIAENSWVGAVAALGHDFVLVPKVDATCTSAGTSSDYYKCSRCNLCSGLANDNPMYVHEENFWYVAPLGHQWYVEQWNIANDNSSATADLKCSRCQGTLNNYATTRSVTTDEPSCTGAGHLNIKFEVSVDGFSDNTVVYEYPANLAALGHDWGEASYAWEKVGDNWQCTASHTCQRQGCGETETETVTATGAVKTAPTCIAMGTTTYTVTFQKAAFATQTKDVEDIAIDPTAHDLEATPAADATCTSDGNSAYWQCKYCGHYFADDQGNTDLGNTLPSQYIISALGHDWGEASYAWADDNSTCTASRTCQRQGCGETETETVNVVKTGDAGDRSYTATFTKAGFTQQTKPVPQYHYDNLDVTNGIPAAPSGEFFAAWFADADYSGAALAADADITEAYAKFIKVETMTVGVQIRLVSSDTTKPGCSDVRFITTVPDSKYFAKIGFRVTMPSHGDVEVINSSSSEIPSSSSSYLYDSIISMGSPVSVADFGSDKFNHRDSAKLVVVTITGMPASYFEANNPYRIKVEPYIVPNDGTRTITGPAKYFKGATDDNSGERIFITSSTPLA